MPESVPESAVAACSRARSFVRSHRSLACCDWRRLFSSFACDLLARSLKSVGGHSATRQLVHAASRAAHALFYNYSSERIVIIQHAAHARIKYNFDYCFARNTVGVMCSRASPAVACATSQTLLPHHESGCPTHSDVLHPISSPGVSTMTDTPQRNARKHTTIKATPVRLRRTCVRTCATYQTG